MGSSYSYLKIKIGRGDLVGVFAFNHRDSSYRQIKICTHPDSLFNETESISYNRYYSLGDWYYYDGDRVQLDRILRGFNPKSQNLHYLIGRLEAECELEKYESIGAVLRRWASNTAAHAKSAIIPVSIMFFKYLFMGGNPTPPTLPSPKA